MSILERDFRCSCGHSGIVKVTPGRVYLGCTECPKCGGDWTFKEVEPLAADIVATPDPRITAAIELCRKYNHPGCEPGKHQLACEIIHILKGTP